MSQTDGNQPYDGAEGTEEEQSASSSFRDLVSQISARMVLGFLAAVALIVFIAQNTDDVGVSFLGWDWDIPLFLLLLVTVALSALCTVIIGWFIRRRRQPEMVGMYMGRRRWRR